MNLETFLADKVKEFTSEMKKAAEKILGDVECDYLPWLESDYASNVRIKARDAITDFAAGRDNDLVNLNAIITRAAFVDALYERHGNEIIKKLGEDYRAEIKRLKEDFARWGNR